MNVSFTVKAKEDITFNTQNYSLPRRKATLAAIIKHSGHFIIRENQEVIKVSTENAKVAKYVYQLVKDIFGFEPNFSYITNRKFGKKIKFNVVIAEKVQEIIDTLAIDFYDTAVSRKVVYSDDTLGGYFTGAFLASGSMTSPTSSNYHLEIVVNNLKYAERLAKMLDRFEKTRFSAKVSKRRDKYIVYLKRSDQISTFLVFVGAANASLEFESIRIDRDMQNTTNRMFICDEANYNKTLRSSEAQIENIKIVQRVYGDTPEENVKLGALMKLRLEHEDATLNELAEMLTEELNAPSPISKGNVNHLFIKLKELAAPFKDKDRGNKH
ncbi:MAG: DNA-binding protein WhiA [Bacilli bacterium]|nr:DNA-binding protein WhiA [Bacilli bacterium]